MSAPCPQVLVLSKNFAPQVGGGVRRVHALTRFLPDHDFAVISVASGGAPDIRYGSTADRVRTLASKVRLGRVYRRATRWLTVPDDGLLDLPNILSAAGHCKPDLILASGPPNSIFVAAQQLAKRLQCPWVADLRDPWTDHPRFDPPSSLHHYVQNLLEAKSLRSAAAITAATSAMATAVQDRLQLQVPLHTFYNGYDREALTTPEALNEDEITLGYFGSFYGPIDPTPLVRAVAGTQITLVHAGADYDGQLKRAALENNVKVHSLGMLSPEDSFKKMQSTHVLAMVLPDDAEWAYCRTQKLAEYLGSSRPILALVPEGEAASLIEQHQAGIAVRPSDTAGARSAVEKLTQEHAPTRAPPSDLSWQNQIQDTALFLKSLL